MFLGFFLFFVGFFGTFFRIDRVIMFILSIELMWLGISICFLSTYLYFLNATGLIFSLIIFIVAAGETAIGLSLLVNFYRVNKSISFQNLSNLRG